MADPTLKIAIGALNLIKPSSARIVALFLNSTSNAYQTLLENGTEYQVPVGKKLWLLQASGNTVNVNPDVRTLYQTNAVNSSTGAVTKATLLYAPTQFATFSLEIVEFAAQKYPTINTVSTDRITILCIGLELDA
ncbi:MAG: hypothetical protein HZA82_05950 [Thaumarchaeota archaeon]|nr:hypothetical protein [Nitrososphaerota archaeon]